MLTTDRILIAVGGAIALLAIAAAVALGVGFALAAFYLYLAPLVSEPWAALATAALAFGTALTVSGVTALAIHLARRDGRRSRKGRQQPSGIAAGVGAAERWIVQNPGAAGVAALGAGVVLGLCPELRRALGDGLTAALKANAPHDNG